MSSTEMTIYWGFVVLGTISLVGGWFLRQALIKGERRGGTSRKKTGDAPNVSV
jgi:hypothetical protein